MESIRRKLRFTTVYAFCSSSALTRNDLVYLEQAKALGSRLLVGVPAGETYVKLLCAVSCVDDVFEAGPDPAAVDNSFLKEHNISVLAHTPAYIVNKEATEVAVTLTVE